MEASAIQQLKLPDMWLLLALLPASGRLCPEDTACVRGNGISPFALSMRSIHHMVQSDGNNCRRVEQLRPEQYYLRGKTQEGRSAATLVRRSWKPPSSSSVTQYFAFKPPFFPNGK